MIESRDFCDCDCESVHESAQGYKLELSADDRESLIQDKIRRVMQYLEAANQLPRILQR